MWFLGSHPHLIIKPRPRLGMFIDPAGFYEERRPVGAPSQAPAAPGPGSGRSCTIWPDRSRTYALDYSLRAGQIIDLEPCRPAIAVGAEVVPQITTRLCISDEVASFLPRQLTVL